MQLEPYSPRKVRLQNNTSAFPGVSLRDFIDHTAIYERQLAPFSARLQRATRLGIVFTLLTFAILLLLPAIAGNIKVLYFPFILPQLWHNLLIGYMTCALFSS